MKRIKIKIMAVNPKYIPESKYNGDSGFDLKAELPSHCKTINPGESIQCSTGISIQLPKGYEAQVRPRSGLSAKDIIVPFGTIDNGYRGKIGLIIYNFSKKPFLLFDGDRVAQLVIAPVCCVNFETVAKLDPSERGEKGFGSTGVK